MNNVTAILSLLDQPTDRPGSATQLFRGRPVLTWTLARLARASGVARVALLCWDDQIAQLEPLVEASQIFSAGPRQTIVDLQAIAASLRWSDGWRGGLLGTCAFDRGFHGPSALEVAQQCRAEAVLLVDPDAGLIDPALVDQLVEHAAGHPTEYCFMPAAPGLSAALIRISLLQRLAAAGGHLGSLLHYHPDRPGRDPILCEQCAPVPMSVARTLHRFTLDCDRQIAHLTAATESLNGQLLQTDAECLVARLAECAPVDPYPRDVTLELTTRRATTPIYSPLQQLRFERPDLPQADARRLFGELARGDDARLTFAGVGDPLMHPQIIEILSAVRAEGIHAVNLETDLAGADASIAEKLADSPLDVLSVHIPATSAAVYAQVMGADRLASVIENVRRFLGRRAQLGRATPILVPTFTKCRQNILEMEAWYDYWLRAVGAAAIVAPSDCAGRLGDVSVADMSPPARVPCRRLSRRMTILCDGRIVSCEEDVQGEQSFGQLGRDSITDIWQKDMSSLRRAHEAGRSAGYPLCGACRHWHRP